MGCEYGNDFHSPCLARNLPGVSLRTIPQQAGSGSDRRNRSTNRGARVSRKQAQAVRLVPSDSSEGWALRVMHDSGATDLSGPEALRMAGLVLPHVNQKGAAAEQVDTAINELEQAGGAEAYFQTVAQRLDRERDFGPFSANDHRIGKAPLEIRLALEMAAHEQAEQRALEGELHVLEQAWKEAEEIAAIADRLLLPASIDEMLHRLCIRSGSAGTSP